MNRATLNSYWFDFGNTVNETYPLNYEILKRCRLEINNLKSKNTLSNLGSKENPIKLNFSYDEKYPSYKPNKLTANVYENIEYSKKSFWKTIKYHMLSAVYLILIPLTVIVENHFKIKKSRLKVDCFFTINGKLYITFKDSFLRFNSQEQYLKDLAELNDVKTQYLYRWSLINSPEYFTSDYWLNLIAIRIAHLLYSIYSNINAITRIDYRLAQTDWGFYIANRSNAISSLFSGLAYLWRGLRFWLVGLLLGLSSIYYLLYVRLLPFTKILFAWVLVAMFLYWLISGFVFFVKKYQFSKFTSSIQRFWKRTYIIFWSIEGFTFLCFMYLTLNASAEPIYMYDQIRVYKTHLFSWRWFLIKLLPSITIILLGYYLLLSLKWNTFNKQSSVIIIITLLLLYILWLEFYQFFHILSFFGNIFWSFDYDEYIWTLELDTRRTRLANNYIAVCLFLKFWHFVFIFLFWVFFVLRVNELGRARYPLLAANLQNFVIIYIMSWAYMYPWFKFVFRKYLDVPYYWFYLNGRDLGLRVFFTDLKLFFYGFSERFLTFNSISSVRFSTYPFFYWISSSEVIDYNQYRKHAIRDLIIANINSYII